MSCGSFLDLFYGFKGQSCFHKLSIFPLYLRNKFVKKLVDWNSFIVLFLSLHCVLKSKMSFGYLSVTTGYLSHDYWPSLLCVPEGAHHVRFYNLTNTRTDGFLRYYRCSKCCTIKVSSSRDIKNRRYQVIPADFQVPKLQIRGDQVVTNWAELQHYQECEPTPIPNMIAEQLDRRARRQASLGLIPPREAWTEVGMNLVLILVTFLGVLRGIAHIARSETTTSRFSDSC